MRMVDPILQELEQEAAITRRVLERVPEDKLTWKPHPKSMTLSRLATHTAEIPAFIAEIAHGDSFDFTPGRPGAEAKSRKELLEILDNSLAKAKSLVGQVDDAKATGNWSASVAGNKIMTLPRIAVYRALMMNHLYHHRGQLSVYLRLLDVPVPSIYGPSADDNPFLPKA